MARKTRNPGSPRSTVGRLYTKDDDQSYRGYLIRFTLTGACFIERAQISIGWAKDTQDAQRIIDELLD